MNDNGPFSTPAVQRLIARVGIVRIVLWFVAIFLPICAPLSLVFAARGQHPSLLELVLRGGVLFAALACGGTLFVWLIVRTGRERIDP